MSKTPRLDGPFGGGAELTGVASALSFKPSFENPAAWRDVKSQQRRLRLRTERPAMPQPNGEADRKCLSNSGAARQPDASGWLNEPNWDRSDRARKREARPKAPQRKSSPRKRLTRWCEIVAPDTTSDASDGARPSDRRAGMVPPSLPLAPQGERVPEGRVRGSPELGATPFPSPGADAPPSAAMQERGLPLG